MKTIPEKNNLTSKIEGTKNGALDNKLLLSSKDMKLISSTISYLHKSVAEFLYSKDIWGDICKMIAQSPFDANASLALGALLLLRSRSPDSLGWKESIYPSLQHFTSFLTITETFSDREYLGLIDVCDKTMAYLHKRPCLYCSASHHWEHHCEIYAKGDSHKRPCSHCSEHHRAQHAFQYSDGDNLLTFAIRTGLHRYVQLQSSRYPMRQMVSPDQPLILVVLRSWFACDIPLSLRKRTLEALLQNYALNEPSPDRTYYWQYAINAICKAKPILRSDDRDRAEFLKALLSSNKLPETVLHSVWTDVLLFSQRMQNQPQPRQSQRDSLPYDRTNEDWDAVMDEMRSLGRELEQLLFDLNANQVLAPSMLPPQY